MLPRFFHHMVYDQCSLQTSRGLVVYLQMPRSLLTFF